MEFRSPMCPCVYSHPCWECSHFSVLQTTIILATPTESSRLLHSAY